MSFMCDRSASMDGARDGDRALNWYAVDVGPVMLAWVPAALLLASLATSLMAGFSSSGEPLIWMLVLTVAAFGLHWSWIRARSLGLTARILIFSVQLTLAGTLVWLSPFFGIYGFMGYVVAMLLFDGAILYVALGCNAVILAASQIGGVTMIPEAWGPFLGLMVINTGVVIVLQWAGTRRAREMHEREEALSELEAAQRQNAELGQQLIERAREQGVLEERARLSREIHDTVAQDLVAIVSQLEAIDAGGDDWNERVDTAKRLARAGLGEARRAVYALRSPMLDTQPLSVAMTDLVHAWSTVHKVDAGIKVEGSPVATDDDQNLLRICQEALSNVSRHADAQRVDVNLSYVEEGVLLDIRDDGSGFDAQIVKEGNGIRGIRERVEDSGGTVSIDTDIGRGCLISAVVPA